MSFSSASMFLQNVENLTRVENWEGERERRGGRGGKRQTERERERSASIFLHTVAKLTTTKIAVECLSAS